MLIAVQSAEILAPMIFGRAIVSSKNVVVDFFHNAMLPKTISILLKPPSLLPHDTKPILTAHHHPDVPPADSSFR